MKYENTGICGYEKMGISFFHNFLIKDSFLGEARFLLSSRLLLFYVRCSANEGYLSVVRGHCQTTPLFLPQPPYADSPTTGP